MATPAKHWTVEPDGEIDLKVQSLWTKINYVVNAILRYYHRPSVIYVILYIVIIFTEFVLQNGYNDSMK